MTELNDSIDINDRFNEMMEEAVKTGDKLYKNNIDNARSITKMDDAIVALNNAEALHLATLGLVDKGERDNITTLEKTEEALSDATESAEDYKIAMSDLDFLMSGKLTDAEEDFTDTQVKLGNEMQALAEQIRILEGLSYLTPEQFTQLGELKTQYEGMAGQYTTNADEHEKATKRILLDLMIQKAAQIGMVNDDVWYAMAEKWGLISEEEKTAMQNADLAVNWLKDHPNDIAFAESILQGQQDAWVELYADAAAAATAANDYLIKLHELDGTRAETWIYTHHVQTGRDYGAEGRASGGPVNAGVPYLVGERGPELFVPNKNGNIINNTMTMNVNTNAGTSTITRDFAMMKAMAG